MNPEFRKLGPYCIVIGEYRPSVFIAERIGTDLTNITINAGLKRFPDHGSVHFSWYSDYLSAEVRNPYDSRHSVLHTFHRDGPTDKNSALVLWSTTRPTEILLPDHTIVQAKPYELVLVHNYHLSHRSPKVLGINRWFYRRVVLAPEWLKETP